MGFNVGFIQRGRLATGHLFQRGHTWWLEQREGGKRSRRSLGTTDRSRAELLRWQLVVGDTPALIPEPLHIPLAGAIDRVASDALSAGTSPATVVGLRGRWERIVSSALKRGTTSLDGLEKVARAILHEDLLELTAKTRREYALLIRRVCRAHGVDDPTAGIKIRGQSETRRALTPAEVDRLLASTSGELRLLVLLGLYTGARLGDCCRLTWGSIEGGMIRFTPAKTAKSSGRGVVVPVHADLAAALPPRGLPQAPVMPGMFERYGRGRHLPAGDIRSAFETAGIATTVRLPGVKKTASCAGAHSLRHTFISRLASAGVGENIIMAMAGHTNAITSRRYQHLDPSTLHAAVTSAFAVSEAKKTGGGQNHEKRCPRQNPPAESGRGP